MMNILLIWCSFVNPTEEYIICEIMKDPRFFNDRMFLIKADQRVNCFIEAYIYENNYPMKFNYHFILYNLFA
jgi:hypothetical protein